MKGIELTVDGKASLVDIDGLDDMQAVVDGPIQILDFPDASGQMILNEEGKIMGKPVNSYACAITVVKEVGLAQDDYVVGNVLLLGSYDSVREVNTDVPKKLCDFLMGLVTNEQEFTKEVCEDLLA